jgi:hypothetical protein
MFPRRTMVALVFLAGPRLLDPSPLVKFQVEGIPP